ncbi:MAG: winged helix-turn-helix domain-containing protein [Candidatus Bathyarchaeia archaeon]
MWLETDDGYVFGPGVYSLLRKVRETGTLKEAAESLGMSYRYAWGLVKRAEGKLGQPLLKAHKGGRSGGGGAELTEVGEQFLDEFSKIEAVVSRLSMEDLRSDEFRTRNKVEGLVKEVTMEDDRAEIALTLSSSTPLRLRVPKDLVVEWEISEGDHLSLELTSAVRGIEKRRRGTPSG